MIQLITDLANQGSADGDVIFVPDGEAKGDGMGGTFRWDVADIQDGDVAGVGANVIKVTGSATGSWLRQDDPLDSIQSDISGLKTAVSANSGGNAIKKAVSKAIAPIINNSPAPVFTQSVLHRPVSGGTVNIVNNAINYISPSTGALIASLTINMPASPNNGDSVLIKFVQQVTTVTYTGGTMSNATTAPSAKQSVPYGYFTLTSKWE